MPTLLLTGWLGSPSASVRSEILRTGRGDSGAAWQRQRRRPPGSFASAGRFVMCSRLAPLVAVRPTESDSCWHHNLAVPVKFEVMVPVPVEEKRKNVSLETRDAVGSK